jgi:hypothetical protein
MKNILLFCLLGFTGCATSARAPHQVYCMDNDDRYTTFNVMAAGNVSVFTLQGHPFLVYRDAGTNKVATIDILKNDCEIE